MPKGWAEIQNIKIRRYIWMEGHEGNENAHEQTFGYNAKTE